MKRLEAMQPQSETYHRGSKVIIPCFQAGVELFYIFPIVVFMHALLLTKVSFWALYVTLVIAMLCGGILGKVMNQRSDTKMTFTTVILSIIIGSVTCFFLFYLSGIPFKYGAWTGIILSSALTYRGYRLSKFGWVNGIPIEYFWVSYSFTGVLYSITLILPHIQDTNLYPTFLNVWLPYQSMMQPIVLFGLLFNLLFTNAQHVHKTSYIGEKSMLSLKDLFFNQMYSLIVIFLIGVVYTISTTIVIHSPEYVGRNSNNWITLPGVIVGVGNIGEMINFDGESSELGRGIVENKREIILYVGVTALVIAMLLILNDVRKILRWLLYRLKEIFYHIWKWLLIKEKGNDAGFEDETTNLNAVEDIVESTKRLRQSMQKRLRIIRWSELKNNKERIRFLYSRLILRAISKGFPFSTTRTPVETMQELKQWEQEHRHRFRSKRTKMLQQYSDLGECYNRVRYGDINVDDQEVNRLKEKYATKF